MNSRTCLLCALPLLTLLSGCPPLPPPVVTCEVEDACGTTGPGSTSDGGPPTTSEDVQTVTGDDADTSAGSTAPAEETGDTTDQPVLPPQIVDGVVIPTTTACWTSRSPPYKPRVCGCCSITAT